MKRLPKPFEALPDNALKWRALNAQSSIFYAGRKTTHIYFLETGNVTLSRWTEDGHEVIIHKVRAGEAFAEAALFSKKYHCDAMTKSASMICAISKREVLASFENDQRFALELTKRFSEQVQSQRRKLEILAIRKADERVLTALADGLLTSDIKSFSAEIGLTHEAVYRSLAVLTDQARVLKDGRGQYRVSPKGTL